MIPAADVLNDAMAQIDSVLEQAIQRAGQGVDPHIERRLDAVSRRLDAVSRRLGAVLEAVDPSSVPALHDTVEAAKRVMEAANPEAPRLMLELARDSLARALRRHESRGDLASAA